MELTFLLVAGGLALVYYLSQKSAEAGKWLLGLVVLAVVYLYINDRRKPVVASNKAQASQVSQKTTTPLVGSKEEKKRKADKKSDKKENKKSEKQEPIAPVAKNAAMMALLGNRNIEDLRNTYCSGELKSKTTCRCFIRPIYADVQRQFTKRQYERLLGENPALLQSVAQSSYVSREAEIARCLAQKNTNIDQVVSLVGGR